MYIYILSKNKVWTSCEEENIDTVMGHNCKLQILTSAMVSGRSHLRSLKLSKLQCAALLALGAPPILLPGNYASACHWDCHLMHACAKASSSWFYWIDYWAWGLQRILEDLIACSVLSLSHAAAVHIMHDHFTAQDLSNVEYFCGCESVVKGFRLGPSVQVHMTKNKFYIFK